MSKCKCCNKNDGLYQHFNGGKICEECVGSYFICPDCGRIFDQDDFENGDQATGFCKDCSPNH